MDLHRCPRCGTAVEARALCPACLLRIGLSDSIDSLSDSTDAETAALGGRIHFAPTGHAPRAGDDFGAYRIIRLLGRGGFGFVWEAEHRNTQRRVALKVVTEVKAASPDALARFEREGRLAASVSDPHCVFVYGAEVIARYPTIVMELMPGGTLQDELNTRGHLPAKEAVDRILDALDGLAAAHRAGVLHRDVKPSNCFVDETGAVKIGDFGISSALEGAELTRTGSFLGTPVYTSPEQARGRDVDIRSDIYSLGATLYALLSGRPPFAGGHPGEVLARVLSEEPSRVEPDGLPLPNGLHRIVRRTLAKDPAKRYASYAALRAALLPFSSSGLTAATLAQRFCAYAVDLLLIGLTLDWPASVLLRPLLPAGYSDLLNPLLTLRFYYFVIAEGHWHRSFGKRLFGLHVTTAAGFPPSWSQAIARTTVFWYVSTLAGIARHWLIPGGWPSLAGFLASNLDDVLIFLPMRARNGYAGLHELLSGSRVMASRDSTLATVPNFRLVPPADSWRGSPSCGPYRTLSVVWHTETQALVLARDDVLQRNVWVHQSVDAAAMKPMEALAISRGTRLRWLSGSRVDGHNWDAYEAPSGTTVRDWVNQRGRLSWSEARRLLTDVALEIQALAAEDDARSVLSLERVWVDAGGRAKLLDFVVDMRAGDSEEVTIDQWRVFIHSLVVFMLEGRVLPERTLSPHTPQVPLPEHARTLVAQICNRGFGSIDDLVNAMRTIAERPALVTPGRRMGSLMAATMAGAVAMIVTSWIWKMPQPDVRTHMDVGVLLVCAVPMIALALALQGNAWLQLFGIAVRRSNGQPAGGLRCGVRAAVLWLPLLPILRVLFIEVGPTRLTYGFDTGDSWLMAAVFPAALACLVGSASYALVKPERSVPDLVCGTHLTPI